MSWKLVISDVLFAGMALVSLPALESQALERPGTETTLTIVLVVAAVACWWLGGVILDIRRLPPLVVGSPADGGKEH